MFMFPLQNLACKELKYCACKEIICIQIEMTYKYIFLEYD